MGQRLLYLDTFAIVRVISDAAFAAATRNYMATEGLALVVGTQNLIELVSWRKRWSEVVAFVSSVPLCFAQNPEDVAAAEIESYPTELACLPVAFSSLDHSLSAAEISDAIFGLERKVVDAERKVRRLTKETLQNVVNKRESFLPENEGKYSSVERQMFMQSSVLSMLFPEHHDFLKRTLAAAQAENRKEGINIERFKSVYIQALAIFLEYYTQKKPGKFSDMGDILQLSLLPYADLAVLDNERNHLIQKINRENLFPSYLNACNLRDFKAMATKHAA